MNRDIYNHLVNWKRSANRKPLVLQGARQVGKTYILKEFGKREYDNVAYLNFEEDSALNDFFKGRISPERIIEKISIYLGQNVLPEKSLIIFDEVQNSPETLTSLKYFQENAHQYHIIAAGSLLGVKVGQSAPFPVGKVNFQYLYPFSFGEYLDGIGKSKLRQYLDNVSDLQPIEQIFHNELIENLKMYYYIGGMPEAIAYYNEKKDLNEVRKIQKEILKAYSMDFSKYATKTEAMKILDTWNSIPGQLAKENKKFKFSEISKNARWRDYAESIRWLIDSGLIYTCYKIKAPKLPLSGYREDNIFKLYVFDVGLLGAILNLTPKTIVTGDTLFSEYNGAFVENYVAQELIAYKHNELYYWSSGNNAEVDFIVPYNDEIYPLEVKSGRSRKKKSLNMYGEKYKTSVLSRLSLMNFKQDGKICNYPLYAVSLFPKIHRTP